MSPPITDDDKKGRTSAQIREAPPGAVYIIANMRQLGWFTGLAAALGRGDITFTTPLVLEQGAAYLLQGKYVAAGLDRVVIDHWAEEHLTPSQAAGLATVRELAATHEAMRARP